MSDVAARTIRRHSLLVRVTHWVNALTLLVMLLSGLEIFNSHPSLYWGQQSHFDKPFVQIGQGTRDGRPVGLTIVGGHAFVTTGLLGYSKGPDGRNENRAFPAWLTLPSHKDLASGRHWHFFFAWLLVLNGLTYLVHGLASRHVQKDLAPTRHDLADLPKDIWDHLRLKFPRGEDARRYHVLQKLAYSGVAFVALPIMVLTGLTMSPNMDAGFGHGLLVVFGGRQSARTLHFIMAWSIVLFVVVHLAMVVLSGFWNNVRSMITGTYVLPPETTAAEEGQP